MIYRLNDILLSGYDLIPSPSGALELACTGILDFPSRKGDTEHDWGVELEPFCVAADMAYNSRSIVIQAYASASSNGALIALISQLQALADDLITLEISDNVWNDITEVYEETVISTHTVYFTGELNTSIKTPTEAVFTMEFEEPNPTFSATLGGAVTQGGYSIEGYSLMGNFGIVPLQSPDYLNIPARIAVPTTDYYPLTQYRGARDLVMSCVMEADTGYDLFNQMAQFHKLLAGEGLLTLSMANGVTAEVYCKDGFKLERIVNADGCLAFFTLILREPTTNYSIPLP